MTLTLGHQQLLPAHAGSLRPGVAGLGRTRALGEQRRGGLVGPWASPPASLQELRSVGMTGGPPGAAAPCTSLHTHLEGTACNTPQRVYI